MPSKPAMPAAAKPAPSSMGGKAAIGLVGLVVGLVAGYGAGRVSTGTPVNPIMPSPTPAPVTGAPTAENPAAPQAPNESTSLNGTAVTSDGNRLTFDADLSFFDPTGAKKLPVRRVAAFHGADPVHTLCASV